MRNLVPNLWEIIQGYVSFDIWEVNIELHKSAVQNRCSENFINWPQICVEAVFKLISRIEPAAFK